MVIVTTISFKKNVSETQGRTEGLPPVPDYITMTGPYIKSVKFGGGIQTVHLFEFDESRLAEAHDFIDERLRIYKEISELTYSVELWLDLKDVLNMTGLERGQAYASA